MTKTRMNSLSITYLVLSQSKQKYSKLSQSQSLTVKFQHILIVTIFKGVVRGFNGTIFAYGQTSSGKTFTMEGPSIDSDENQGIIPRMMDEVFDCIMRANESIEFTVKVSFLEIYNEKIHDLLDRIYIFPFLVMKYNI